MNFLAQQKKVIFLVALFALLWCPLSVFLSIGADMSFLFKVTCALILVITLIRPILGIGLFLLLMPFFGGSKPQDVHTIRFLILLSTVVFAGGLSLIARVIYSNSKVKLDFSNPLTFALLVYWLVAAGSLVSIPPNEVVLSIFDFRSSRVLDFLNLSESSAIYPYLAFFTLTSSLLLGLIIVNLACTTKKALLIIGFFLLGLLLTVVLGLLDYYDFINLNFIRPWYFLANDGESYRFQHLTSVFGNPGWYAQYLVLGAPALLVILTIDCSKRLKLVSLICLMVITEFCIILIYQRGGWLSYPLTLIITWFCIYVLDADLENFSGCMKAAKNSLLKISISLPLTIIISISLVYLTARSQPENRQQLSGFAQRAESITNVNDRLKYWEPAFLMASLHPLFGPGLESFASQYAKLYVEPGHRYVQTPKYDVMPYAGSAHNLYFQTVAGKGLLGLLSLFGIFAAVLTLVWRGIFSDAAKPVLTQYQRLILMMMLAYSCALAIYGNVGEIFYSPIGYIPFVLFYAISIGTVPPAYKLSIRFRVWVLGFLVFSFLVHLYLELGIRFAG